MFCSLIRFVFVLKIRFFWVNPELRSFYWALGRPTCTTVRSCSGCARLFEACRNLPEGCLTPAVSAGAVFLRLLRITDPLATRLST